MSNHPDQGILKSLRYYDTLRLDPSTNIVRNEGSNVDLIESAEGDELTICHLSGILPFTQGNFIPQQPTFEAVASIALAVHHLNSGDGSIVAQLSGLDKTCKVRFSVEFADTEFQGGVALGHIVDQTSRNGRERLPCAFLGAYRSAVSIPMSIVTGLLGYPQVSGSSTSENLDDTSQYPMFARTIPSDAGNAVPIIMYLRNELDIKHLALINVNDAYGNAYVEGLRNAAAEHAPDMLIHQIPLDEGQSSIESAVANLKRTTYRFVFGVVFTQETHDALLSEAFKQGAAGSGNHNWLFADSFAGTLDGRTFEKDSPLHLSYRGSGILEVTGGVAGMPGYDNYVQKMQELANPDDLDYLGSLFPKHDHPNYGSTPPFIDDPNFLSTVTSTFSPLLYEATIALGLSACDASREASSFSGQEHFDHLRNISFDSLSGKVFFDPTTGTRDPSSAIYKVANFVEEELEGTTGEVQIQFKPVVTDLFLDGAWDSREQFFFNDGTTNRPSDLPPPVEKDSAVNLALAIAIPAAAAVLVGLIIFLFYEHKRKSTDSVWKVKKEDLDFSDPPEIIGRGTFGLVVLAEYRGTQVAVKRVIPPKKTRIRDRKKASNTGYGLCSSVHSASATGHHSGGSASGDDSDSINATEEDVGAGMASGVYHEGSSKSTPWGLTSVILPGAYGKALKSVAGLKSETGNWRKMKEEFMEEMRCLSKLRHPCVTTVMGAVIGNGEEPMLVLEYMDHGSLYDLLHNETMVIEGELLLPILRDISQGLRFLHAASPQVIHGDLKSANILVDSRFRAKVADFGLSQKKSLGGTGTPFWMAPELLRYETPNTAATDVFSFGVILYEVYSRRDPYEGEDAAAAIHDIADPKIRKRPPVPPSMSGNLKALMADCLEDQADKRPTFEELDIRLKRVDAENVDPGTASAKKNSSISLFDIFPRHIAEALRDGRKVEPEQRDSVTIFFSDIVGFTRISSELPPGKIADLLDRLYSKFDFLSQRNDVFKVETIGDSYMAVTNLIKNQPDDYVKRIAKFSIEAIAAANGTYIDTDDPSKGFVNIRVGFHSGSIVADVVGTRNPRYCLFGDAVNTASRMESNSKANRINCSNTAADLLKEQWQGVLLKSRGLVSIKGKGDMHCFWVNGQQEGLRLAPGHGKGIAELGEQSCSAMNVDVVVGPESASAEVSETSDDHSLTSFHQGGVDEEAPLSALQEGIGEGY